MFLRVFQTDKTLIRISPLSAYLTPAGQKQKREKEREVWLHWEQVDEEEEENEERENPQVHQCAPNLVAGRV